MDMMSRNDLRDLVAEARPPCVSIYLPTHAGPSWMQHDLIALKNLLVAATRFLMTTGMRRPDAEALLRPASALLEDSFFWQHLGKGLAIFACPGHFERFRLPIGFEARAVVAGRFHIRPLLDLFAGEGVFFVLELGTKGARLHRVTRFGADVVPMPEAPRDLAEELRFDDFEKHVEARAGASAGAGGGATTYFGHGGTAESAKDELLRYFRDVDTGLRRALALERGPVVLAGVAYFQAIFRSASSCRNLIARGVEGSPAQVGTDEMLSRARSLVEPYMGRAEDEAADRYRASEDKGLASGDTGEVVRAASAGRVGVLLAVRGRERWGRFATATGRVALHERPEPGDEDLAELATAETIAHGGAVYSVEPELMPEGAALAAVFRY